MKLLSIIALVACTLLLTTSNIAAQPPSIPFSACGSASGPSIVTVTSLDGFNTTSSNGQLSVVIGMNIDSTEEITGTYNISVNGQTEYSGSLDSILDLPITEGAGYQSFPIPLAAGGNDFTVQAYDQNANEVLCFTFNYMADSSSQVQAKSNRHKNNKKHTTRASATAGVASSTGSSAPHRRQRRHPAAHVQHRGPRHQAKNKSA